MTGTVRVSRDELQTLAGSALKAVGIPEPDADAAAAILVTADLQGIDTHGTWRLASYITRIRDGVFNAKPDIVVESSSPAVAVIEGDRGLGPVIGSRALDLVVKLDECFSHHGPLGRARDQGRQQPTGSWGAAT
jgi:LDH2 family malate/lactate/ureidoglycolate dehydrogenase